MLETKCESGSQDTLRLEVLLVLVNMAYKLCAL